jgi:Uma2 family endonuclease
MSIGVQTFEDLALANQDCPFELHEGGVREKPPMARGHNRSMNRLGQLLAAQLDPDRYWVNTNSGQLTRPGGAYYIPDVCVIPVELMGEIDPEAWLELEVYSAPLPLVVEIWSPSTGDYDQQTKVQEYQRRGDLEILRLHPFQRSLTSWQRQADGSYVEMTYQGGKVRPVALPGVEIDLDKIYPPIPNQQQPRQR